MTAYFNNCEENATVSLDAAVTSEKDTLKTVFLVMGDREFPDHYRQKIWEVKTRYGLETHDGQNIVLHEGNVRWYNLMGYSRLLSEMHRLWHDIGSAGIQTRFGILSDSPATCLSMRDEHERIQNEYT